MGCMRLRRACTHNLYDAHGPYELSGAPDYQCPGGEFLPELIEVDHNQGMTHFANKSPVSISLWIDDSFLDASEFLTPRTVDDEQLSRALDWEEFFVEDVWRSNGKGARAEAGEEMIRTVFAAARELLVGRLADQIEANEMSPK